MHGASQPPPLPRGKSCRSTAAAAPCSSIDCPVRIGSIDTVNKRVWKAGGGGLSGGRGRLA
eukprot:scaffold54303_cov59-Phaeocystis_antarctica.AAC.1